MWTSVHKISSDVCDNGDGNAARSSATVVGLLSVFVGLFDSFAVVPSLFESWIVATVINASVLFEMFPMGIAFPNFSACVLFLVLVERRISGECGSGVALRSILLAAGCLFGDGVLWFRSVSDESEIEVSHSNWIFVRSTFDFFLGLILPRGIVFGRRCVDVSLLLRLSRAFSFPLAVKGFNSFWGPRALRFNVCWMISCVVFGGGLFGLVIAFSPCVSLLGVFLPETCGLALGRCL